MKVLTLWQPWATLMVLGLKKVETRSWPTTHRGLIAIHAAANEPNFVRNEVMQQEVFQRVFAEHTLIFKDLPRGRIIGTVNVDGMMSTQLWIEKNMDDWPEPDEYYFGDYTAGRWAWLTSKPLMFEQPIPAKGSQGFWNYDLPST